jgi:hypothetical protein
MTWPDRRYSTEIAARIGKLRDVPGRMLLVFERNEERYAPEEKSRAIDEALSKLRWVGPAIQKLR